MVKNMIIGITGFLASGKGAVSEILKQKGFIVFLVLMRLEKNVRKTI